MQAGAYGPLDFVFPNDHRFEAVDTKPRLSLVSRRFEEVINKISVIFEQGPDGRERGLNAFSDGQQSLLRS